MNTFKTNKKYSLMVFFLFSAFCIHAQIENTAEDIPSAPTPYAYDNALDTRVAFLESRVSNDLIKGLTDLLNRVEKLEVEKRAFEKTTYTRYYNNIKKSFEIIDNLESLYKYVQSDIKTAQVYNTLARVNNPTSRILGFNFEEIILGAASESFKIEEGNTTSKKSKFKDILKKIVKHPVVDEVTKEIPIANIIRSAITAACTFFTKPDVALNVKRNGNKVSSVTVKEIEVEEFQSKEIEAFTKALTPYLNFYEGLEKTNTKFDLKIENLLEKYKEFPTLVAEYKRLLIEDLGLDSSLGNKSLSDQISEVDRIFEYSFSPPEDFNYHHFVNDEDVLRANNKVIQIALIVYTFESLYAEYVAIVNDNFTANKYNLENAKVLKGASQPDIDRAIRQIEDLQNGGFINKFSARVENLVTLKKEIIF